MTPADIDRRKALIVACLYPTRVKRGFITRSDVKGLATLLGVSRSTLLAWESGDIMPPDKQVAVIERWLVSGLVWRYDRINHIVGPESWPEPLGMARNTARQDGAEASKQVFNPDVATEPASEVGAQPGPAFNPPAVMLETAGGSSDASGKEKPEMRR